MTTWRPDTDIVISDSEDEEDEYKKEYHGREALLFVVDANLYENRERFNKALEIIKSAFISGMLVNDKDMLGIVFANTEMSPEPYEPNCIENISVPQNCAVFLPLRQLTKAIVEHYIHFLETAAEDFEQHYGVADNGGCGSFAEMLRLSLNLFEHCGFRLNNAILVYMTDRETPHPLQSREFQRALEKSGSLKGQEIEFKVIPMVDEFNYELFYKEFLSLVRGIELESFVAPDAQQQREILADRKLKQDFLKRSLGHFSLSLGPDLEISAQYFNYFNLSYLPHKVKLMRKDNSIVKQKRVVLVRKQDPETLEFDDAREIKSNEFHYEINLGGMPIRITLEQMNRVRNLHTPGMMLLGFKSKFSLNENMYYLPCNFMYPNDDIIKGSKRLFCALWERCRARDKIAICLFMRKRKSIPRYVALVPVAAADNEDNETFRSVLTGDGFKIVYLPMAKHFRHTDFSQWNCLENTSSDEGVDIFHKIIRRLRMEYQPNLLGDPTLEQLQSNLLALALDIKTENETESGMPDTSKQDERIEKLITNFEEIFGNDIPIAKKRPATKESGEGNAAKMPKVTEDDIKRFDYVEQMIGNKTLELCTIAQLRTILDVHFSTQMPKSAKKQAIIDRINELNN